MLTINHSNQFKRDLKTCEKRGYDCHLLKNIVIELAKPTILPTKNKDHKLTGNYVGYRECHILPDWLLIYRVNDNELYLTRTGTHSDLFNM